MKNQLIRSFIYVDTDRLNSFYSQTFEGVINAVLESYSNKLEQGKNINRPLKGHSLESQVAEISTKTENKILYDHMYNLLEDKLKTVIYDITQDGYLKDKLKTSAIIKIKGKASIQDYNRLKEYLENFNDLGKVIASSTYSTLSKIEKKKISLDNYAKLLGVTQDKNLLSNINTLTNFFNKNGYEVLISPKNSSDIIYKGILNKSYLRTSPDMLRALYGDEPPMEWTMVGQITNYPQNDSLIENSDNITISESYSNMFQSYRNFEKVFYQTIKKETISIAPIAIYTETSY